MRSTSAKRPRERRCATSKATGISSANARVGLCCCASAHPRCMPTEEFAALTLACEPWPCRREPCPLFSSGAAATRRRGARYAAAGATACVQQATQASGVINCVVVHIDRAQAVRRVLCVGQARPCARGCALSFARRLGFGLRLLVCECGRARGLGPGAYMFGRNCVHAGNGRSRVYCLQIACSRVRRFVCRSGPAFLREKRLRYARAAAPTLREHG